MTDLPRVAVFDAELPPSVAFARSLGRRGVPVTAYSPRRFATTKLSRHVHERRSCPPVHSADAFIDWLVDEQAEDRFDLIALTSDFVAYNVMEAFERTGSVPPGYPTPEAVRACLFKDRFQREMERVGFPVPPASDAVDVDDAVAFARSVGFPVVLKPRSHAGVGVVRGAIAHDETELRELFVSYELDDQQSSVLRHDGDLAMPLVQRLLDSDDHEVVSVTGVIGADGDVLAVGHSRKQGRWPGRLGVGTIFEPARPQPFTEHALQTVRDVLGCGIFELEVVVHRPTGDYWGIDLNPRAFGQIGLDIGLGNDLPALWYESVTGVELPDVSPRSNAPTYWQQGVPVWVGAAVEFAGGSDRLTTLRRFYEHQRAPHVGSAAALSDPLPGLAMGWSMLRHPRALVRSIMVEAPSPNGDG